MKRMQRLFSLLKGRVAGRVAGLLVAVGIMLSLTTGARAALLVYEPFDYETGALTGQNGGTGFGSAWQHYSGNKGKVWWPNSIDTFAGGNSWDGEVANIPMSSALGEYRFAGGDETVSAYNRDIYRPLSSSIGALAALAAPTDTLWMSVVVRNGNSGAFGLGLGDGYTRNRGLDWEAGTKNFIGWAGYTTTWITKQNAAISTNAAARDLVVTQGASSLSTAGPYVLVFKFTFSPGTGDDTCQMYAFDEGTPLSEATFNGGALSATVAGFDENACDVFSYAHNGQENLIDEIRIGDSFADVAMLSAAGQADPAKSSVDFTPAGVPADGTTSATITVTVLDGFSTPQVGDSIVLTGSTGNATVTPVTPTTDANGQAVFTVKSSTAGVEVFTASNTTDSVAIWQTADVAFQAGTGADVSTVTGTRDFVTVDGTISTLTVTLLDSATATPIVGHNVTLTGSAGNATITPAGAQVSDANGQVTFDVSSSTVETEVFTATDTTESVTITQTFSVDFKAIESPHLWVYEPFDYAVGELSGNNGGLGFATAWTYSTLLNPDSIGWVWDANNGTELSQGTMDWDGVVDNIPVSTALGQPRFTGGAPGISEAKRDIYRELSASAGEMAGTDGVLWMSAVLHDGGGGSVGIGLGLGDTVLVDRGGRYNFRGEGGAQTAFIGSFGWSFYGGGGNDKLNPCVATNTIDNTVANINNYVATDGQPISTGDFVLLFKFRFSGFEDSVECYAFTEDTALSEATFDDNKISAVFPSGFNEDACTFITWSSARGSTCLDEIRIGSTFDDIIGIGAAPQGTLFMIR